MKRTTMELGGHGPVLVFKDIDLDKVLDTVVPQKFRNAGQVCVSPTRFIIEEDIYDDFVSGFASRAKALKVGNGLDKGVTSKGAKLHTGGERIGNQGFYYAPTVLSDVPRDSEIMNTEPFGPVALCNPFRTEEEAISEANRLPYGLASYAWTQNAARQKRIAHEIETGMLGINTTMIGGADSPFGGVKWSGHGHEDGPEGLEACLVTKVVHEG